jgi:hypothetical protein
VREGKIGIVDDVTVDVERLREEIQDKYVEVLKSPDADFHFHTGRRAAARAGYLDEWFEGLPESSITSFAGVANPFHWGCRSRASTWSTWGPAPGWTVWSRRGPWDRKAASSAWR